MALSRRTHLDPGVDLALSKSAVSVKNRGAKRARVGMDPGGVTCGLRVDGDVQHHAFGFAALGFA